VLPRLPIIDDVWDLACRLATASRAAGFVIPNPDIIIAACARYHDVQVEAVDRHFSLLSGLAV
jgi:predicted nucleic acid-binding protein